MPEARSPTWPKHIVEERFATRICQNTSQNYISAFLDVMNTWKTYIYGIQYVMAMPQNDAPEFQYARNTSQTYVSELQYVIHTSQNDIAEILHVRNTS